MFFLHPPGEWTHLEIHMHSYINQSSKLHSESKEEVTEAATVSEGRERDRGSRRSTGRGRGRGEGEEGVGVEVAQ